MEQKITTMINGYFRSHPFHLQDELQSAREIQEQRDKRSQICPHRSYHICILPKTFCRNKLSQELHETFLIEGKNLSRNISKFYLLFKQFLTWRQVSFQLSLHATNIMSYI